MKKKHWNRLKSMILSMNFILIFFFSNIIQLYSQEAIYDKNGAARELLLDEQIKTVQFYRQGWINSYPIMTLHSDIALMLEFDELADYTSTFSYRIIHCNANWTPSELTEQEYMEGYYENQIREYESSFNTYYNYVHYNLSIPNKDIKLTRSGNYLLLVYRDFDEEALVFSRRFMISEAAVSIEAKANRPVLSAYRDQGNEIDINVEHSDFRIDDPYSQTTLSIYQNGIWDFEITGLKPLFINPGKLIYDYQEENVFLAGNEFRMFNTTNTMVRGYHIQNIEFVSPYFHYELKEDESNPAHLYFDRDDINGKYFIESADGEDPALDADYAYVHFSLKMPYKLADGEVYIAGELSNWQFTESNKMTYDATSSAYRGILLLKQGIYNYRYVFIPNNRNTIDISEIEGSHYETENEYMILFYYQGPGDRFDRLIGHQVIHSNIN